MAKIINPTRKELVARLAETMRTRTEPDVKAFPWVYFLGKNIAAKEARSEQEANEEVGIGIYAFEEGISIAKMYDVAKLEGISYIFMERIRGTVMKGLTGFRLEEAEKKLEEEVKKIRNLGIEPDDSDNYNNSILEKNGRLRLIDAQSWHFIDPERRKRYGKFARSL
jgi:hypothetical protein